MHKLVGALQPQNNASAPRPRAPNAPRPPLFLNDRERTISVLLPRQANCWSASVFRAEGGSASRPSGRRRCRRNPWRGSLGSTPISHGPYQSEQSLLGELRNEVDGEKRIAAGLLMDHLRQRGGPRGSHAGPRQPAGQSSRARGARMISCTLARFADRASFRISGWSGLRCLGRRRSAAGAAHPAGSVGPRSDRGLPRRAIASRQETGRADAPAARIRR